MKPSNNIEKSIKQFVLPGSEGADKQILNDALAAFERVCREKSGNAPPSIWRTIMKHPITKIAAAASFLIISSWAVSFVLYKKVNDLKDQLAQRDIALAATDDTATINLYLKEHQNSIARQASVNSVTPQPAQIQVSQSEIMYYELFDNQSEFMSPGIIVRGPSSQRQINSSETPTISNGHTLTLSEAGETANFDLVSPSWLHPGYKLSQIRIIEGRDALQLLYNNGINSISLFEQPLDGQRQLSHHDFREYAVYNNQSEGGRTILAWRDDNLSYVLIGNIEMSQLMDMAQTISAKK